MTVHVRLSNGSDGLPVGYPVQCIQTESQVLTPGFDVIWTVQQLEAAKEALRPQYEAAIATIRQPVLNAIMRQRIRAKALQLKQEGGFLPNAPPGNLKWLPSDTYTLATLAAFAGAGSALPAGLDHPDLAGV
jgi:hypothetical protein